MSPHSTTDDSANRLQEQPAAPALSVRTTEVAGETARALNLADDSVGPASAGNPSTTAESNLAESDLAATWPETVLTSHASMWGWNLQELWRYRELGLLLAWRDIVVHYKQTMLGIAWALLRPSLLTAIFALFVGRMVGSSAGGLPYALFVFTALLPWTLFSTAVSAAANSVIGSERLITKVYFPRLLIPLAAIGPALVDFVFGSMLLVALLAWYGVAPAWSSLLAILPIAVALLCSAALGALLAALNVVYRDIRHALPFLIQAGMFATPAIYMPVDLPTSPKAAAVVAETNEVPAKTNETTAKPSEQKIARETAPLEQTNRPSLRTASIPRAWLVCNPLNACVSFFRAALFGSVLPWGDLALATVWGLVASLLGGLVFHRLEATFADVV
jgi:lipopolysaccharide transport system permease protein